MRINVDARLAIDVQTGRIMDISPPVDIPYDEQRPHILWLDKATHWLREVEDRSNKYRPRKKRADA